MRHEIPPQRRGKKVCARCDKIENTTRNIKRKTWVKEADTIINESKDEMGDLVTRLETDYQRNNL